MWDEVVIGNGPWGNSAWLVRDLSMPTGRCHVSQNDGSFWISGASYLDVGMRIAKDTKEGKLLVSLFEKNASDDMIREFLEAVVIKKIEPEILKSKVHAAVEAAFNAGCEHQAALIRKAMLL